MREEEFIEYLKTRQHIYIYGAGNVARRVYMLCNFFLEIDVEGIIVTKEDADCSNFFAFYGLIKKIAMENKPINKAMIESIYEIPVMTLQELQNSEIDISAVDLIVCVKVDLYGGTCSWNDDLYDINFRSRFVITPRISEWLKEVENNLCIRYVSDKVQIEVDNNNANVEKNHLVLLDENKEAFCRCEEEEFIENEEALKEYCNIEDLQSLYGDFAYLKLAEEDALIKDIKIDGIEIDSYVVISHLDNSSADDIKKQGYVPIQVGAALTDERKDCITDDTGYNISDKNRDYSECTGIYWIWKNTSSKDYVGINHYRRRLLLDQMSMEYIKENDIDVVLALPHFCVTTVREFFMQFVSKHDWQLMKESIERLYPDYIKLWEEYENSHFYFHGNLALWKREWFNKYSEFAFSVAKQIENEYESRGIIRLDRYMGFLFENLTSFFVMVHKNDMNISCTQMKWIE